MEIYKYRLWLKGTHRCAADYGKTSMQLDRVSIYQVISRCTRCLFLMGGAIFH